MSFMRHFPFRELGYVIGFLLLMATLYIGSYYATVQRYVYDAPAIFELPDGSLAVGWFATPKYCIGEESALFFRPMHQFDRLVRPGFWESIGEPPVGALRGP
jgi:hypothetical protein